MKKHLLLIIATFFMVSQAHAIIELRAGYGVQTPADDDVNSNTLKSMAGFNLDAILELPMVPFGFGLRYESLGSEVEFTGIATADSTFERTSLLINYRIIDLFAYFGLIGSVGFVNDFEVKAPAPIGTLKFDDSLTYSVGAEGGLSFGLIMVGAELGYMIAKLEGSGVEADLSGVYAKALVGVGF